MNHLKLILIVAALVLAIAETVRTNSLLAASLACWFGAALVG